MECVKSSEGKQAIPDENFQKFSIMMNENGTIIYILKERKKKE